MGISVIIPTFNGAKRIAKCLDALRPQAEAVNAEIIVVNDGSTDETETVLASYSTIKVISQLNAGPAVARNAGAEAAMHDIILFTDDDCVPDADWLEKMARPFLDDPAVGGVRGRYLCNQTELTARFVQIEYEDRYRLLERASCIDFIDTYSAGYRRDLFLQYGGFDVSFPVACAEDIELSYRMSAGGVKMVYQPSARVSHSHPTSLIAYMKKKYKFAYWRILAVNKNPRKAISDTHTPQVMKLQLLMVPIILFTATFSWIDLRMFYAFLVSFGVFVVLTIPFVLRAWRSDSKVAIAAPAYLSARAVAQFFGVAMGAINLLRM